MQYEIRTGVRIQKSGDRRKVISQCDTIVQNFLSLNAMESETAGFIPLLTSEL